MTATFAIDAMLREAVLLERTGRLMEAAEAYERLLRHYPQLPDSWFNLAVLRRKMQQYDAALAAYQQALDRGVTLPEEVHLNRGVIYSDHLRQDAAAERELLTALRINPRYLPALLNLANLNEDRGERARALAQYERILALAPDFHEALARYANLKAGPNADAALLARVEQAAVHPRTSPGDRASLGFALGKMLDACGRYDEAYDAYAAANRASRLSAASGAIYDRNAHERFFDELIATFTPERFQGTKSDAAARPIFICGMHRSGSTLVEQVLAGHSRLSAGGELEFLPLCIRNELQPFPASVQHLQNGRLAEIAARYQDMLERLFPGGRRVTDKRPENFLYLGLIKLLFPGAKIVHTTRHPFDTCISNFFLHLDHGMSYALDILDTGHYYRQYRRLMAHWKSLFGDDIFDFDYDRFVADPRTAAEPLLAHLELAWEDECLALPRKAGAVKTASVWQVREPLYRRSSGRWRHYARQLAPLRAYLSDLCPDS